MTATSTSTYAWDYLNRMTQSVTSGATTTYGYDITNERVLAGPTMYPFIFYNTQGATTTIAKHIFVNGEAIADIQGSGATTSTYYLHTDQLRGTNVVSNSAANIDQLYSYYPYGATRVSEKNGSFTEQRQFIGDEYDPATSLNYLNARFYNSSQGQFLSEDPVFLGDPKSQILTDPQSFNTYSYSENNPIIKSDPSGKCPECYLGVIGGVAGGLRTYVGDILENRAQGLTGWATYAPRSSWEVYGANVVFGAATAALAPQNLFAAGGLSFLGSGVSDVAGGHQVNLGYGLLDTGVTIGTGGFLNWGTGGSLLEAAFSAGEQKIPSAILRQGLRYSLVQESFSNSVGAISQNYASHQSFFSQATISNALSGIQNAFVAVNAAQRQAVQAVIKAFSK